MKKLNVKKNNEVDLIQIILIIWNEKIKIILSIIISILAFILFFNITHKKTEFYNYSLDIKAANVAQFTNLKFLNEIMDASYSKKINLEIADRFIEVLEQRKELIHYLKENNRVKEKISNLPQDKHQQELFNYAKLLKIEKLKNSDNGEVEGFYKLNFIWGDRLELKNILDNTFNLVSQNLKKTIFEEIEYQIFLKKKKNYIGDIKRIEFLEEQSLIAKELKIADNQVTDLLPSSSLLPSSTSTFINLVPDKAYYLRGYKAIDKEIYIVKNRPYNNLELIEKEVDDFIKKDFKLVEYNTYLLERELLDEPQSFFVGLIGSIIIGIFLCVLYIFFIREVRYYNKNFKTK